MEGIAVPATTGRGSVEDQLMAKAPVGDGEPTMAVPASVLRPNLLPQQWVVILSAACIGCLAVLAAAHGGSLRVPLLALVGAALGFTLFQSTFGFAGSFRAVLEGGNWSGFRAQALALALTSIAFFPLLASGEAFGLPLSGFGSPIGPAFVLGALLFGCGMQIGGGCASGTLFALGGGQLRLLLTLAFFIVGSAWGAATLDVWQWLPALPATTMQDLTGWPAALCIHLAIFALVILKAPGAVPPAGQVQNQFELPHLTRPWPLMFGATVLAVLNALTLVIAGRPWGETSGFTLWGSKIAALAGSQPTAWPYWRDDPTALTASIFADVTSVMDFGIIAGAALAAGLSRRFILRWRISARSAIGAALGGLLMGYGARLSNGCNIGAYFSALASGSLSGWVWPVAAFIGGAVGIKLRRVVGE